MSPRTLQQVACLTGSPKQVQSADVLERNGFTENVSCSLYVQNEPGTILWFQLINSLKCGFQRNLLSSYLNVFGIGSCSLNCVASSSGDLEFPKVLPRKSREYLFSEKKGFTDSINSAHFSICMFVIISKFIKSEVKNEKSVMM